MSAGAQSGGAAAERPMSCQPSYRLELDLGGPEQFVTSTEGKLIELPWAIRQGRYGNPMRVGDARGPDRSPSLQ